MSKYLLLLRGGEFKQYSEAEMKDIVGKYMAWTEKLKNDGVHIASEELKGGGQLLSVQNGQIVDGPYTETKEAVDGFYLIEANDYRQATEISKECPHLQFKGTIELREINPH
ncbi:YciI family protein [bacterium]|nr:YciI family protein [bacterium]